MSRAAVPLDVSRAAPEYENRPHFQRAASDPGLAQSGRAGVRARKGRLEWPGRREAPMSAAIARAYVGIVPADADLTPAAIMPGGQRFDNRTFVQGHMAYAGWAAPA